MDYQTFRRLSYTMLLCTIIVCILAPDNIYRIAAGDPFIKPDRYIHTAITAGSMMHRFIPAALATFALQIAAWQLTDRKAVVRWIYALPSIVIIYIAFTGFIYGVLIPSEKTEAVIDYLILLGPNFLTILYLIVFRYYNKISVAFFVMCAAITLFLAGRQFIQSENYYQMVYGHFGW